jgi:hypothetical protein
MSQQHNMTIDYMYYMDYQMSRYCRVCVENTMIDIIDDT